MDLTDLIRMERHESEPQFASPAEASFCRAWIDARDSASRPVIFASMIAIHVVSILIEPWVFGSDIVRVVWGLHLAVLPILFWGLYVRHDKRRMRRALANSLHVSAFGCAGLLYYATHHAGNNSDVLLATAIHMGTGMFAPQMFPGRRRELVGSALLIIGLTYMAMRPVHNGWVWTYIFASVGFWSGFLAIAARRARLREAQSEYRFRIQVIPEHIVRHSQNDSMLDLAVLFRPEDKFCVCLSSDWRNYQELTSNLEASRLTHILGAYYDQCQNLIRQAFPLGNYYTDWIADELFVVAYRTDETTESAMVTAAAECAIMLLQAKEGFLREHGLPARIDIGIASGIATLGLMGPGSHRKATALGEVPGRARRLQSAGKMLGRRLGERDRLVLGPESRPLLAGHIAVETFALAPGEAIRDITDREIYYLSIQPARDERHFPKASA